MTRVTARILFFAVCTFCSAVRPVHAASIEVRTSAPEAAAGDVVVFQIFLDADKQSINAVSGVLTVPASLTVLDISDANSVVPLWVGKPVGATQSIPFSGVIPGGYSSHAGLLFTVRAVAHQTGRADLKLHDVHAFLNDGNGTEIIPAVIATAHTPESTRVLEKVSGEDRAAPEVFTPLFGRDPSMYNNKWFLSFTAADKGSGITRYQVKEVLSPLLFFFVPWTDAVSPHVLADQERTRYIYVRALDANGNSRVVTLPPQRARSQLYIYAGIVALCIVAYLSLRYLIRRIS